MCNPIPRVVGNPNRILHSAGFLKALTTSSASSFCISTNGIMRVFMLKLKCNYIFRTPLLLVVRNITAKEYYSQEYYSQGISQRAIELSSAQGFGKKQHKNAGLVIFWIILLRQTFITQNCTSLEVCSS